MIYKSDRVYQIIYFWGMSGVFQGLITPDITNDFPHFHFFRFWLGHNGMIIALVYASVVYGMRPKVESIKYAFIGLNIFSRRAIVIVCSFRWIKKTCMQNAVKKEYLSM